MGNLNYNVNFWLTLQEYFSTNKESFETLRVRTFQSWLSWSCKFLSLIFKLKPNILNSYYNRIKALEKLNNILKSLKRLESKVSELSSTFRHQV